MKLFLLLSVLLLASCGGGGSDPAPASQAAAPKNDIVAQSSTTGSIRNPQGLSWSSPPPVPELRPAPRVEDPSTITPEPLPENPAPQDPDPAPPAPDETLPPEQGAFNAHIFKAPGEGAIIGGKVLLMIQGEGMVNAELLGPEGYAPKYATFYCAKTINPGKACSINFDTTQFANGPYVMRISVFDAPAGQTANEIVVMPPRQWYIDNTPDCAPPPVPVKRPDGQVDLPSVVGYRAPTCP